MRRPAGVVVIAILYWFGAFTLLVMGLVLAVGATVFSPVLSGFAAMIGGVGAVGGVVLLAFGVGLAFEGYGLFTLQEWARMVALVLAVIGIVFGVLSFIYPFGIGIFGRVIRLAINVAIVWYLSQPQIKMCFRS